MFFCQVPVNNARFHWFSGVRTIHRTTIHRADYLRLPVVMSLHGQP